MPSLGELFIELGVIGDTKELDVLQKRLDKAAKAASDFVKTLDDEINYQFKLSNVTDRVAEAKEKLAKATDEEAKKEAESALAIAEKTKKMLEERKAAQEAAKTAKASAEANRENINSKKELAKNIAGVVKGFGALIGAATLAVTALNKMADSLTTQNQAWVNFTRQTDLSLQSLQKWGSIGNIVDKSLGEQGLAGTLADLNERIYDLILTGQGAEGFMLAGISPLGTNAEGVLEQLRNRVQGLDNTSATYLLKKMGLDPRILPVLRMTREEFNALNEEMKDFRLSDKQVNTIQNMNTQLQIAGQKFKYLKDRAIIPIVGAWTTFISSLENIVTWLTKGVKAIADFISKSEEFKAFWDNFKGWFAATVAGLLIAFAPIQTFLAALYLIIDDIAGYFNGKDSGIGYLINALKDIKLPELHVPEWINKLIEAAKSAAQLSNILAKNMGEKISTAPDLNPEAVAMKLTPLSSSLYNSNTTYNYDQRAISQNNVINTQQPATDIQNELIAANAYFAMV